MIIRSIFISIAAAYVVALGLLTLNKKPAQKAQTVQIIQNGDTAVYSGYIHETQYFVKVFDSTGTITRQYRGNLQIKYINK